jgi:glycosyltransferase involved in cell wall biosynthesis
VRRYQRFDTVVGLPSVVTNVGGMREVAHLPMSGVTIPAAIYKALADAIREAATNRYALAHFGNAARDCYEQNFTLDSMAQEYIHLYKHS